MCHHPGGILHHERRLARHRGRVVRLGVQDGEEDPDHRPQGVEGRQQAGEEGGGGQ